MLRFVHRMRREVRKDDRSKASTMQWQARKAQTVNVCVYVYSQNCLIDLSILDSQN